jgi:hypothetical protein
MGYWDIGILKLVIQLYSIENGIRAGRYASRWSKKQELRWAIIFNS